MSNCRATITGHVKAHGRPAVTLHRDNCRKYEFHHLFSKRTARREDTVNSAFRGGSDVNKDSDSLTVSTYVKLNIRSCVTVGLCDGENLHLSLLAEQTGARSHVQTTPPSEPSQPIGSRKQKNCRQRGCRLLLHSSAAGKTSLRLVCLQALPLSSQNM